MEETRDVSKSENEKQARRILGAASLSSCKSLFWIKGSNKRDTKRKVCIRCSHVRLFISHLGIS